MDDANASLCRALGWHGLQFDKFGWWWGIAPAAWYRRAAGAFWPVPDWDTCHDAVLRAAGVYCLVWRWEMDNKHERAVAKRDAARWGRLCVALVKRLARYPESPLAQSWAANAAQAATVAFGHARVALGYTIEASR